MNDETTPQPKAGTALDLSRRMDRIEDAQESARLEVATLATTVSRVESNQVHAEELNKLRFGSLETAIGQTTREITQIGGDLKGFMTRVEGMVTGEIETAQSRAGRELVQDYTKWRGSVEERFDTLNTMATQARTTASLIKWVLGGSVIGALGTLVSIYVAITHH